MHIDKQGKSNCRNKEFIDNDVKMLLYIPRMT